MTSQADDRADHGASLIEVGIVVPMLLLLAIGLTEVGFLVIDYVTVTNSARSGARTGAAAATSSVADDEILQVVEEDACNLRYGDLVRVTIYKADADGDVPFNSNHFRVYEPTVLGSLLCDDPAHSLVLQSGTWDPADRDNVPPDFDELGVKVDFTHNKVTNIVPFPAVEWSERAIMQVEPDVRG